MSSSNFRDFFSGCANQYASYRPTYPRELIEFIVNHSPRRELAWDCATGSGQVAVALAEYFKKVFASDASEQQIAAAKEHENVEYRVWPAEKTELASQSVDLITVGQALHWFHMEKFFAEAKRVLKSDGLFTAWCYHNPRITEEINKVFDSYYNGIFQQYMPKERLHYVDTFYSTIAFPLRKITVPQFFMEHHWDLSQMLNYLGTWSAVTQYEKKTHQSIMPEITAALAQVWKNPEEKKLVRWPVYLVAGYFT